jgi:glycosyltransferase involved in cell wall biosynthesis
MNHSPLISVLMTAYNREQYIGAAIESVMAQTFTDFELLIVDDRSTDGTRAAAEQYARQDPRIRLVVNDRNLTDYVNRNHAAQLARGQYLKYLDSDDLMYPWCLATMVGPLAKEPRAGFALSMGWSWPGGPCPMLLTPRMCYQREFLGFGMFMCGPPSALFRADVFRQLGGFPEMGVGSDHIFWLKACARVNVLLLPADLFWYRSHPGQEFHSPVASAEYALVAGEAWRALQAADCPLADAEREQAKCNWAFAIAKLTYRDLRAGRLGIARLRLAHAGLSAGDWLRYLRRPKREALAGTPLDDRGEFVTPDWSHYRIDPAAVADG